MATMVSPARRPAVLPASKTSATTFAPESYIVRQPKSGLLRQRAMLAPYRPYIVAVSATASPKATQWVGTADRLRGLISRPRLRFREALPVSRPSPGERRYDEEQRGDGNRGLREDVAVQRVEGLRPGKRHIPDQEPGDEQVLAVAVRQPLEVPCRADEPGDPGGGRTADRDAVLHSPEDIHGQGLVAGRRRSEERRVGKECRSRW